MNWSKLVQKNLIVEQVSSNNKDNVGQLSITESNNDELNISNEDLYEFIVKPHIFDEFYDFYIEDKELYGRIEVNDLIQFFESNLDLTNIQNILEEDDAIDLNE